MIRIQRYYITNGRITIGPSFSRKGAERCARKCGPGAFDPAMRAVGRNPRIVTAGELRARKRGTAALDDAVPIRH